MAKTERELIKAEPLKVSTLSNGLTIASLENHSPVTTIGVAIKAGARNEGYDNAGVTHALRVASGMATSKNTAFGICRNLQQVSYNLLKSHLTLFANKISLTNFLIDPWPG